MCRTGEAGGRHRDITLYDLRNTPDAERAFVERHGEEGPFASVDQVPCRRHPGIRSATDDNGPPVRCEVLDDDRRIIPALIASAEREQHRASAGDQVRTLRLFLLRGVEAHDGDRIPALSGHLDDAGLALTDEQAFAPRHTDYDIRRT